MLAEPPEPADLHPVDGCVSMNPHKAEVCEAIHDESQRVPHLELTGARDDARRVSDRARQHDLAPTNHVGRPTRANRDALSVEHPEQRRTRLRRPIGYRHEATLARLVA